MLSMTRRQPTFQDSAVGYGSFSHLVASVVNSVGLRVVACLLVSLGLVGGGAFAATGDNIRKIVVFQAGTSMQVKQRVIAESGSHVLSILSLINGVAIELPAQNAAQALTALQADPAVTAIYDDLTNAGQDGGGDNVISSLLPILLLRSFTLGDWTQSMSPMCIKQIPD
jgi:hypothetical protein